MLNHIDDLLFLIAVALVGTGLWKISPGLALVFLGLVSAGAGLMVGRIQSRAAAGGAD